VLNSGITGYGPNQYAAVVKQFAPIYRPDLINLGFFVNDYQDVLRRDETFRESIGFDQPSPDTLHSVLKLPHLKRPIQYWSSFNLWSNGYSASPRRTASLGNFIALEPAALQYENGSALVASRLREIKAVADSIHAHVILAMIPTPVQICAPSQLAYSPRYVDLADKSKFDLDLPQRLRGIRRSLSVSDISISGQF